jgi:hypothetical protein
MRRVRTAGCALVLAAAGCSGGGDDDFAAEANAVCADYDERIAAIETPADLDALSRSAEEIAALIQEGTAALGELEPPEDLADGFGEWLELNDEASANARQISAAAEAGDRERIVELAALAEELGLEECLVEEG